MLPGIVAVFGDTFVQSISTLGGAKAQHTADWRLESYTQAITLIIREPFGVSYETYQTLVWFGRPCPQYVA